MDTLGRLRQLLTERGWTEYRLAKESGLSDSTIKNIYKRNTQPTIETLEAICRGTRRYAKRQLTWFRRMPDVQTIYADAQTDVFDRAVSLIGADGLFAQGG